MKANVTVEAAIKRGKWMLDIPGSSAALLAIAATGLAVQHYHLKPVFGAFGVLVFFVVFGSAYLSFMGLKWWIWAFTNVDDVRELEKSALTENYICDPNAWLTKWFINITGAGEQVQYVTRRIADAHASATAFAAHTDNLTVPPETAFYRSRRKYIIYACITGAIGLLFTLLAWSSVIMAGVVVLGITTGVVCIILWKGELFAGERQPLFVLSNEGIATRADGLTKWPLINNDKVVSVSEGRSSHYELTFDHPNGAAGVRISDIDVSRTHLNHLLCVYRNRSLTGKYS